MLELYKDASQSYAALKIRKWFGAKFELCADSSGRRGLYILAWYPKSRARRGYASAFLPRPF